VGYSGPLRSASQGARHAEYIYSVVESAGLPSDIEEEFSASWERSIRRYGLDPAAASVPRVLSSRELGEVLEPIEEIEQLYTAVRAPGYVVLLSDASGVAVELRGEDAPSRHLKNLGSCVGGVWSEEVHGTNGIGTCIAEKRPITVHRAQHFRSRHTHLSCSGAPVFGTDGKLIAVLDVSSVDPTLSERAHALTGFLTLAAARAIEERFFRVRFRNQWVVAIAARGDASGELLAIDRDQKILGANRGARDLFFLDDQKLQDGVSLWSIFERNADSLRARHGSDFLVQLTIPYGDETRSALITPPANSRASLLFHARPRLDLLNVLPIPAALQPVHGGLPPGALRRVRTHVEEHLAERIPLAELAAAARLSVYHFSREFKRTVGVSPHSYVIRRRVEKAQVLLARTDLLLSDIAVACGFFDQSHLSRHFRQLTGLTPAEYRWSQR
jgi:transcriptional regulator of acetoin/glycerol metabolism/AraC-like DNA-binding protein